MSVLENTQMLSEHQPAYNNSQPIGYEPTGDEEKAIKMVDKLFMKAKNARKAYDEKWLDYYRMFRGKQWKDVRPSYRHSEVINLIFRAIQSDVPILTDVLPKPEFIAQEPNDLPLATILNDVFSSDWTYNNWSYKFTESLFDSHIYGTGFGSTDFDPDACMGMGSAKFESEDPFYQFPDPYAKNVNEDCNYYIVAKPEPVEKIKKKYPQVANFIKPDLLDISKRDKQITDQIRYKSPLDNRVVMEGSSAYDLEARDEVLVITCYIKDDEIVEEEVKSVDDNGFEQVSYLQKLKYPTGRKIVTCGGVLLEDSQMEAWRDKKFPYMRLTNYMLPREFWGMSEVEQLESPQKIFNRLISYALDVLTLMGNPIWVVDTTSGVLVDNLFNRPGLIVEKEPGSEVRREEGVQLQPYVLQMIDRMKSWFDDVSGSNDVSRGVKPEGVSAASAITALQDAAQTRLRQKGRFIDAFMQEFGQHYLDIVFEFYTAPRVFRITNDKNSTTYFKFHVEQSQDQMTGEPVKIARFRPFNQGVDGKYYEGEEQAMYYTKKFDVKIGTGSVLPFEKSKIEAQSLNLFDRQIIDAEEVLKNIRYPNYESIIKRMADKAMMAQQAQMGAGQAPMPTEELPPEMAGQVPQI
jgi:hypothetical protein